MGYFSFTRQLQNVSWLSVAVDVILLLYLLYIVQTAVTNLHCFFVENIM